MSRKHAKLGIAKYTEPEIHAAIRALEALWTGRRPDGASDRGGRWYPSQTERQGCCALIREPSRSWRLSLLKHCQSLAHIEAREGARHEVVLAVRKELKVLGLDPSATSMSSSDIKAALAQLGPGLRAQCERGLLDQEAEQATPAIGAPRSL